MIPIALALITEALWLILSPWSLTITLWVNTIAAFSLLLLALYGTLKSYPLFGMTSFFIFIGLSLGLLLYLPALKTYQTISLNIPTTIKSTFKITRNQYPNSTTIQILTANLPYHQNSATIDHNSKNQEKLHQALKGSTLRVFNIDKKIKDHFIEGDIYQGKVSIKPRFFKNIPGDYQRIYQALARKEIGYGKFEGPIERLHSESKIDLLRKQTAKILVKNYRYGRYLSALSVGITDNLTPDDWNILRKTGTIHLVSISGLHLSLTAFYAFIIFRVIAGLCQLRSIEPYKMAALCSIIVAWSYALIAGMSLPTTRAAIMFSLAMIALLINRPIFSLHGVSIALLLILIHNPLSILLPGFWLSFVAVVILILSARLFSSPLKALLLTQLIISLLLIPLTASFFGEVSLISPVTNLFAIPWTSLMIMPALLLGTLLLFLHPPTADILLSIADQATFILTKIIQWSAYVPYAAITTSKISLVIAFGITFSTLSLLYFYPKFPHLSHCYPRIFQSIHACFLRLKNKKWALCGTAIGIGIIFTTLIIHPFNKSISPKTTIELYLLPVGEGLSLLFHSQELTFLFDTGNRFRRFDAGSQIILPTLKHLNIQHLDRIFLSLKNQQHIGGTRMIRTQFPKAAISAHHDLTWLINKATDCREYHYQSHDIVITPILEIHNSCAFQITLLGSLHLYLFSDISHQEWQQYFINHKKITPHQAITHEIWLYPNQGRSPFPLQYSTILQPNPPKTLLFSTREISSKNLTSITPFSHINYYNSYYGTIHLSLTKKNAKSPVRLRIKEYADKTRYWWLQP